jgi:hypothetical protein
MPMKWLVNLPFRRCESPEEARKRRLCRKMLELPPEIQYSHFWPGLITLSGLSALLGGLVAWRLDAPVTIAWGFAAIVALGALATLAAGCARILQHYRHVAAGVLVLSALLALLAVTVHQQGYLDQVDAFGRLDRSALNDSNRGR